MIVNEEDENKITDIVGDKQRFQQILLNIIQNGVKFTYKGGVEANISFHENYDNDCINCGFLKTTIKDTGIGMEQTLVKKLFRIFGTVNEIEDQSFITT